MTERDLQEAKAMAGQMTLEEVKNVCKHPWLTLYSHLPFTSVSYANNTNLSS